MLKNKKMHIIDKQLSNFNFYKSSNSYRELKEIIYSLLVNKELSLMPFRTGVFKEIAEEFDTTSSRPESNLSKLVDRAILNTDSKIISSYFLVYQDKKVSLKAFLLKVTEETQYEIKKIEKDEK